MNAGTALESIQALLLPTHSLVNKGLITCMIIQLVPSSGQAQSLLNWV